jgi:hypothetical protein
MDDDQQLSAELERLLPKLAQRHAKGDKHALLLAMFYCMIGRGRVAPVWARLAFANAYTDVHYYARFGSWDDVFGKPWPKGHLKKAHRRAELRIYVWHRVRHLHDKEGKGLSDDLFAEVGAEFEIGSRQAKGMYYRVEKALPHPNRALARNRRS